ncbi:Putative aspartic peptidase A1 family, aspartic peptidase, active [Septoria linicola]|uniref:Aspartic peptidase A1 family, aspartic peptidase, active n=1 Tax=Septoria linicola TaxID=215465 RepID=A0A9Q9ED02_9PEZI|nr:putative aspartic peptidase A1 family, aspartic peptidase, active [Septoria linicola]USW47251.1 Putative aspartic peptidase A1 family, aspartic peptidase, active [Septoria linicola]
MKSTLLLSFSALALAAPTQDQSQGTTIPFHRKRHQLVRRADGNVDFEWFKSTLKTTILKYDSGFALPQALQDVGLVFKRDTDAEEHLTDVVEGQEDELYYGAGQVGAAKQTFNFDFDTGSSDTFVPGPKCGTQQGCDGTTKYDQQGQDEHNTTTVTYGSGAVSGENYFDSVTVAGLTATHQNIISLTQAQGFSGTGSDSLMGMAFQSIANSKQPPFFFSLINQKKVNPTEFSFYLGRQKSGTAQRSEMTLGGRDESRYTGSFTPVPVTSQTYWQVAIDGATVGKNAALPTTNGQAAIDTGTTLVIAPTAAALSIFAQIPGSVPIPLGGTILGFAYPCASKPQVNLKFAGKNFAINDLDFNFGTLSDDLGLGNNTLSSLLGPITNAYCLAGIAGADLNPPEQFWVVGDVFIKNWYSTFQYVNSKTAFVNFAKSK